jgi:hypothetical protein
VDRQGGSAARARADRVGDEPHWGLQRNTASVIDTPTSYQFACKNYSNTRGARGGVMKGKYVIDNMEFSEDRREMIIDGITCQMEIDQDGFMHMEGPDAVWDQMRGYERAHNWLLSVSYAIDVDVNLVDPETLDKILAEHHADIIQFVTDGSRLDVAPEECAALVERMDTYLAEYADDDPVKPAKIEQREVRRLSRGEPARSRE